MNPSRILLSLLFILSFSFFSFAQDPQVSLDELKAQLDLLKADYEKRVGDLQKQIEELQIKLLQAPLPEAAAQVPQQPAVQSTAGALNPAISVVGNFLGRGDADKVFNEEGDRIDNKLNLREVEVDFRAAVDPYADAVLIAAFESEFPGEFEAAIEEGYVTLKSLPVVEKMPLGLRFKIGRFRPLFGRTNILHTHDLPTSFRPLPIEEFLGEEGFVQNGVSTNFYIPTPWDQSSSLDATVEIMDGGDIALSPQSEARIAYLAHLRWFRAFADVHNVELGWSGYFHPSGNGIRSANAQSVDFLYRWKPLRRGQWKSFLLGSEFFFVPRHTLDPDDVSTETANNGTPKGFSGFSQWQFNRRLYSGVRYDWTQTLIDPDFQRQSVTPYVSYYFSEFLRFRVNYEHRWSDLLEEDGRNSVFLELNWIFGAHPPEPFWVNK